jgi:hypothetical protein
MSAESELTKLIEQIQERERLVERAKIVREIQAFAGDYGHVFDERNCIIVEQLLDFLSPPQVVKSNQISFS